MTHEEVMEQVDAIVAKILRDVSGVDALRYYTDKILSIPEILIKDPDQSLPIRFLHPDDKPNTSYKLAQQDMTKRRWVKVLPKEEKSNE